MSRGSTAAAKNACFSIGALSPKRSSKLRAHAPQVEKWQRSELTDVTAKVVIYEAFVEGKLETPKHLARNVHDLYFEPLRVAVHNGSNAGCIVTLSCGAQQPPTPILS
jgi:hypothetical protein